MLDIIIVEGYLSLVEETLREEGIVIDEFDDIELNEEKELSCTIVTNMNCKREVISVRCSFDETKLYIEWVELNEKEEEIRFKVSREFEI